MVASPLALTFPTSLPPPLQIFIFLVSFMCYVLLVYHFYEPIGLYLLIKTEKLRATTYQYYIFIIDKDQEGSKYCEQSAPFG